MTRRAVRIAIVLGFSAALAAAGWFCVDTWRRGEHDLAAVADFETSARRVLAGLADARAGIQAYVAVGQGDAFWRARVAAAVGMLKEELGTLRQLAREAAVLNDLDAAAAAVENFAAINDRASRLVRNEQRELASKIIFGEGLETLASAAERVDAASRGEWAAGEARARASLRLVGHAATGVAALAVLLLAILVPGAGPARTVSESAATPSDLATTAAIIPPSASASEPAAPAASPPVAAMQGALQESMEPAAPPADGQPQRDRRRATELKATADLCTDFARLGDAQELPSLLERTARLIDAQGFIVWVSDPAGTELRPALAHGYGAHALARMPAIPRDADNATAAAWRALDMQVVRTNGMSPGALVTPLMTPGGCIGVVAAEIRHGRESSESVRALARILAAQIATLVSLPAALDGRDPKSVFQQANG